MKDVGLLPNKKIEFKETINIETNEFSDPYWLKEKGSLGVYKVDNQLLIGKPETPRPAKN